VRFSYWASEVIEPLRPLIGLKTLIFRDQQTKVRPLGAHPPLKVLVSGFIFLSDFSGFNPAQKVKCTRPAKASTPVGWANLLPAKASTRVGFAA
jgi:hypothetical protein